MSDTRTDVLRPPTSRTLGGARISSTHTMWVPQHHSAARSPAGQLVATGLTTIATSLRLRWFMLTNTFFHSGVPKEFLIVGKCVEHVVLPAGDKLEVL